MNPRSQNDARDGRAGGYQQARPQTQPQTRAGTQTQTRARPQAPTEVRPQERLHAVPPRQPQAQTGPARPTALPTSRRATVPALAILPLRAFLGLSFIAASLDKFSDPQYLDPTARNYIGKQIALMASGTPLEGFLNNVAVPNAGLFGVMVMGGEMLIGVAVLLGVLTRFSAMMGLLLNLTFFLSATWDVRPFYFGADLPYVFGWLTLALAGAGPYALDALMGRRRSPAPRPARVAAGRAIPDEPVMSRRAFVGLGAVGIAGAALALTGPVWGLLHPRGASATPLGGGPSGGTSPGAGNPSAAAPAATAQPTATAQTQAAAPEPAATTAPTAPADQASANLIAPAGSVPSGGSLAFDLPDGSPAVLVRNDSGYVAYSAICTHRGCTVASAGGGLLACPCHGAQFDANSGGQVVRGPAQRPLSAVAITVDAGGNVYLNQ